MKRGKEMTIMLKIMYSNLEPSGGKFLPQFGWNPVTSFWDKIKRRAESKIQFHFHQGSAFFEPCVTFDIVCQNDSKFFSLRPAGPVFRWPLRSRHNRPNFPDAFAQAHGQFSANRCSKS